VDVWKTTQTVKGAAPPGARRPIGGKTSFGQNAVTDIASSELVEPELIEGSAFCHGKIFWIAGGLPESKAEAQPIGFGTAFGAMLVGTPTFGNSAGDEQVFRARHILLRGFTLPKKLGVRGGVIKIHDSSKAGEVTVNVVGRAPLDDSGNFFSEPRIASVFCGEIKVRESLGLLRPANIAAGEMRSAEFIADLLREHQRSNAQQKIAEAVGCGEDGWRGFVAIILKQAHQQASIAPE
jgi:hypothetical protein